MSGESISPNMSLVLPGVGVTTGPQYAQDLNDSLNIIDQHDHSPGSGVPITPTGLNINQDLSFINNNAINLRSARFTAQPAILSLPADLGSLYVTGVDLYYNDISGNQIQLTQNGGVAGTPGSIANLVSPASAAYVSGSQTFVWQSNINTPANMDFASAILRNLSANSKGLTLAPPAAMALDYTITLPALPASDKILTISNTGAVSATLGVDNSTLEISGNNIQVKNNGITTAKIIDQAVTYSKLSACNYAKGSSGTYTNATSTPTLIASATITPSGNRPVRVFFSLTNTSGAGNSSIGASGSAVCQIQINKNGTKIASFNISGSGLGPYTYPLEVFDFTPGSSSNFYEAYGFGNAPSAILVVVQVDFIAMEV